MVSAVDGDRTRIHQFGPGVLEVFATRGLQREALHDVRPRDDHVASPAQAGAERCAPRSRMPQGAF